MKQNTYYANRLNKALKYINDNLEKEISVKKLAQISQFSLFHFQRLYKSIFEESPYETLLRLRLEKAVFLLKYKSTIKIADVGFQCGFQSAENFSRQFKRRFKISPSIFKKEKKYHNSKIYQETHPKDFYHCIKESRSKESPDFKVHVENLQDLSIVMNRAIFGHDGSILVAKYLELVAWADKNNVNYKGPQRRFGMSIDNPDVTPAGKYRYDFAIAVSKKIKLDEPLENHIIKGGEFATLHCQGNIEVVAQAWDYLYKVWLPNSNYVPKHKPAIEEFIQGPEEIGWESFNIKCRIPIEKIKN